MSHDDASLLCGTYAGYVRHVKVTKDVPCDECRAAATLYHRIYRQRPGVRARELDRERDRQRALSRLARMHPTEFRALYDEERGKRSPRDT